MIKITDYLGDNWKVLQSWTRIWAGVWFWELHERELTWELSASDVELWLSLTVIWSAASEEPWSNILPLSLDSEISVKVTGEHSRAAAIVFARSLILTMCRMQQSKYKEVTAPSLDS